MSTENTSAPIQEEQVQTPSSETQEQEVETTEDNSAQAAAKAEEKKFLKKLELKYKGKTEAVDLPFEIPDTPEAREWMTRELQLAKHAQQSGSDFATLQKQVAQFIDILKTNPKEALRNPNIGVDVKKLAAEILEEELNNSQKSPELIEKERLEAELKRIKEEREQEKKDFEARELERLTDLEFQKYDDSIDKALEDAKDLPKSPYVVKKVAEYMLLGLSNGLDVNASDVMPLVRQEIQDDIKQMFSAMPDEVVEAYLGKERLNNLRKKTVAAAKAKSIPKPLSKIEDVGGKQKVEKKEVKKQSYKDFFGKIY